MASYPQQPVPPDIRAQQQPEQPPAAITQLGASRPMPGGADQEILKQLGDQLKEFEQSAGKLFQMVDAAAPQLKPLFQPIVEAGKALKQEIAQMAGNAQSGGTPGERAPGAVMPGSVNAPAG